ncbi:MAG: hypothetical protein OXB92_04720 [Acidimicrobiaceae bacterium]|nr:hypothetical protein [Acidimicrobiia bacterium]MCY4493146.1 hypothetical protein [Acidimicrobiaceae bacterium]
MAAISNDSDPVTIIAPRELRDLVYRCCRVRGVDPGTADRFGGNLLHAQIHRGAALEPFLSVLASSTSSAGAVTRVVTAADRIALAEVTARREGAAAATFGSAVPLMALSQTLWHAAQRGVASVGISATAPGDQRVSSIELVAEELDPVAKDSARQRYLTAHQQGLPVATSAFVELELRAAHFLVAEQTLDAVSP